MLLNVSYNEPEVKKKIETAVGKPFSLKERWTKGGIGSSKLLITQTSIDIHNLLILDNNRNTCNIELRPKGIILRFRSLLETKCALFSEKSRKIDLLVFSLDLEQRPLFSLRVPQP